MFAGHGDRHIQMLGCFGKTPLFNHRAKHHHAFKRIHFGFPLLTIRKNYINKITIVFLNNRFYNTSIPSVLLGLMFDK